MLPTSVTSVFVPKGDCETGQGQPPAKATRSNGDSCQVNSCCASKRARNDEHLEPSLHKQGMDVCAQPVTHSKETSTDVTSVVQKKEGDFSSSDGTHSHKRLQASETDRVEAVQMASHALISSIEAEAAEDKGSRHTMEDAWVVLLDANTGEPGNLRCAHFAVYDGHGGRHAAEYARAHLHTNVISAGLPRELVDVKAAKKAIVEGFKRTDEALLHESIEGGWLDGATGVSVWVLGQMVFVANIGDAKAVLARTTTTDTNMTLKGFTITREHKAIFPSERARIEKAGGYVGKSGRLLDRLEVSRAFGDRQFKKVGVTAIPDVHIFELTNREHFLILGCDGLWGVFGPGDAVEFVEKQLKEGVSVGTACRRLVREAVRERGCKDNCTAILVVFKHSCLIAED